MSEYTKESLSALLDGEADEMELRRLLKSMGEEPELAQRWQRYNLAQAVLHDRGIPVSDALATNVAAAIADEPALAQAANESPSWQQTVSRLAIAACVAIVAVIVLQPQMSDLDSPALVQDTPTDLASPAATTAALPETLLAEAPITEVDPAAQQRLKDYIEAMRFDPAQPAHIEHLQDSPLYQLVNESPAQP